jgi:hypothetical protein
MGGKEDEVLVDASMLRGFKIFEELNERELEQIAKAAKDSKSWGPSHLTKGAPANRLYSSSKGA